MKITFTKVQKQSTILKEYSVQVDNQEVGFLRYSYMKQWVPGSRLQEAMGMPDFLSYRPMGKVRTLSFLEYKSVVRHFLEHPYQPQPHFTRKQIAWEIQDICQQVVDREKMRRSLETGSLQSERHGKITFRDPQGKIMHPSKIPYRSPPRIHVWNEHREIGTLKKRITKKTLSPKLAHYLGLQALDDLTKWEIWQRIIQHYSRKPFRMPPGVPATCLDSYLYSKDLDIQEMQRHENHDISENRITLRMAPDWHDAAVFHQGRQLVTLSKNLGWPHFGEWRWGFGGEGFLHPDERGNLLLLAEIREILEHRILGISPIP